MECHHPNCYSLHHFSGWTMVKPPTSTIFHHDIPLHQGSWGWSSRTIHVGPWCGSNPTPWGDVANFLLGIILQTPGSVDGKSPFLALKPIFSVCLGEIPLVIIAWNVFPHVCCSSPFHYSLPRIPVILQWMVVKSGTSTGTKGWYGMVFQPYHLVMTNTSPWKNIMLFS